MIKNTHTMVAKTAGDGGPDSFDAVYVVDVTRYDVSDGSLVERWTVIEGVDTTVYVSPHGETFKWRPNFGEHGALGQLATYISAQFPSWEAERDDAVAINQGLLHEIQGKREELQAQLSKLDKEGEEIATYIYELKQADDADELTRVMENS